MKRIIIGISMAAMLGIGMVLGSLATPTARAANAKVTVEPAPGVTVSGPVERAMTAEPNGIRKPGDASPWYPSYPAPDAAMGKGPLDPPAGAALDAGRNPNGYRPDPNQDYRYRPDPTPDYRTRPYPEPPIEKGRIDRPYVVIDTTPNYRTHPRPQPQTWPEPTCRVDEGWQIVYGFAPGEREKVTILFDERTGDSYMLKTRGYDTYYWDRISRW
jgi:hypothetical protein